MATKTNGLEFKRFHEDDDFWNIEVDGVNREYWYDDTVYKVNGVEAQDSIEIDNIEDSDRVDIISGWVYSDDPKVNVISLESFFKKWRKNKDLSYISIEIHKDKLDELKDLIRQLGGKVK